MGTPLGDAAGGVGVGMPGGESGVGGGARMVPAPCGGDVHDAAAAAPGSIGESEARGGGPVGGGPVGGGPVGGGPVGGGPAAVLPEGGGGSAASFSFSLASFSSHC